MLERFKAAGLMIPALMTAAMLPVLIGLGTWQWQRMAWKEGLIAKIEARTKGEPKSYIATLSEFVRTGDVEYTRLRVTGTFDHTQERHLYAPKTSSQGWLVYTLFNPDGGQPPLFVNRGWIPDALKDPTKRAEGQISGPVTITGLARLDETGNPFSPANDVSDNRYFTRDTWAMRWGPEGPPPADKLALMRLQGYAPFSLDAAAEPANPGGWPKGGGTELNIPNRHLEYVITWYGFALTLAVIFILYARQRLKALPG